MASLLKMKQTSTSRLFETSKLHLRKIKKGSLEIFKLLFLLSNSALSVGPLFEKSSRRPILIALLMLILNQSMSNRQLKSPLCSQKTPNLHRLLTSKVSQLSLRRDKSKRMLCHQRKIRLSSFSQSLSPTVIIKSKRRSPTSFILLLIPLRGSSLHQMA